MHCASSQPAPASGCGSLAAAAIGIWQKQMKEYSKRGTKEMQVVIEETERDDVCN